MADPTDPQAVRSVTEWLLDLSDRLARFEDVDPEEIRAYGRLRDQVAGDQ